MSEQDEIKKRNYEGARAHYVERCTFVNDCIRAFEIEHGPGLPEWIKPILAEKIAEDVFINDRLRFQAEIAMKVEAAKNHLTQPGILVPRKN